MSSQPLRILVTGASGFVGGAFIRRNASDPTLRMHGVARRPTVLESYTRLDLSRPFDLTFRPDVVVHAAARASPWGRRQEFVAQNVDATRNVIDFCERNGRPRLVYISSSSVFYRDEDQLDLTEDSPIGPAFVNDYAATKFAGEELVRSYAGSHVVLRPRAVFGPGDTVLLPRILAAARRGRLPLFVREERPAVGDLIYIDNLCDYILAAARATVSGSFNLTNSEPVEIQSLLLDVLARLDIPVPARRVRVARALAVASAVELAWRLFCVRSEPPLTRYGVSVFAYSKTFDTRRAVAAFGSPAIPLADGLARFVAWQRTQP